MTAIPRASVRRIIAGACVVSCLGLSALTNGFDLAAGMTGAGANQLVGAEPTWTSLGPGGGGWVMALAASPHGEDTVFLGGDIQGVFYSEDGGNGWTIRNQGLRDYWLETILYHPADPNIVYAGGTSGVYKSVDQGHSWTWLRTGFPALAGFTWSAPVSALAMDPANPEVIYAGIGAPRQGLGKQGAVYKSEDAGSHWAKVNAAGSLPPDALITSLLFHPSNRTPAPGVSTAGTLYLTSQYGFFSSSDGGVNWTASNTGLPHTNVARVALSRSRPEVMYLTLYTPVSAPWRGGVYKSEDGGRTWIARNTGLQQVLGTNPTLTSNYRELAVDPDDPLTVYLGSTDYVTHTMYKTTNGGSSWVPILTKPQGSNVAEGWNDGFIGDTVQTLSMSPLNPKLLYFGTSVAAFRTRDGGQTWQQAYTRRNADGSYQTNGLEITGLFFITVDPRNPQRVFYGYGDIGLFVSEDGGVSVHRRVGGIPRASANTAYALALDPNDPAHLWGSFGPREPGTSGVITPGFMVAESTDMGRNWVPRKDGLPDKPYKNLLLDDSGPSRRLLVTVTDNGIYASNDAGRSWSSSSTGLAHGDVRDLVADPSIRGTYWAVLAGRDSSAGIVYRSDDRGASWQRVSGETLGAWDVRQLAVSRILYVAARRTFVSPRVYPGGIYASEDGGVTWSLLLEDPFAEAVALDPGDDRVIYAGLTDHPYHDDSRGNGLKVSRDGGATWNEIATLPIGRIATLTLDPANPARVFVGTTGNGVVAVDFNTSPSVPRRRP